jgi:ParB/RepB/Spo0J family partition protein
VSGITYTVIQIPITRIRAFAFQPRKWFDAEEITARAESMKVTGQQDPVTVEQVYGDPDHDYELINGESRLRSAREAGIKTLWAAVRSEPFGSKVEKHLASLVANFNRSDHTPLEISDALNVQMTEGKLNQGEIARAIGKSQSWVNQHISLQKLHPIIKKMMHPSRPKRERLAMATAVELARLSMERQLVIVDQSRDKNGHVVIHRMKLRIELKHGERPEVEISRDVLKEDTAWTAEREYRYREYHRPVPEHIVTLRAGIAEFRSLLENQYRRYNR